MFSRRSKVNSTNGRQPGRKQAIKRMEGNRVGEEKVIRRMEGARVGSKQLNEWKAPRRGVGVF